ncbi:P-loop NTPase [Rarobacter faecitabidus]|uniref:Iron-sulfur cluster carrier protein n=1 Tax=Rarobacter faecitabidus TaxID=13243 RepID=A0A542ZXA7_RARFA|nr:Mrp/NBP35 family ATP-binding protein [Rarobacter faecitabidus]TQL64987.1 ATP-binding protein involved in chromosome partitioning [Rarobacter faecitabidus]
MTVVGPDEASIRNALGGVNDPELGRPITELGMVQRVEIKDEASDAGATVTVGVNLTTAACPLRTELSKSVREAVLAVPAVASVAVEFSVMNAAQRAQLKATLRGGDGSPVIAFNAPGNLTRVLAIASGKGGVGKSSLTANLAASMASSGLRVGVIDADIHGFSIPRMLGVEGQPTRVEEMLLPPMVDGIKVVSIGMFTPGGRAVVWRGPMLHRTLEQFLADVFWGDLDVLLLDLPPGTGDMAISVAQLLPNSELVIVTTPQPAAADVAVRAGALATQTSQRVAGVIENMSWLDGPDGQRIELFGAGGGELVAKKLRETLETEVPLLGRIPLDVALREGSDEGRPVVISHPDSPAATAITSIAAQLVKRPRGLSGMSLGIAPVRA